MFNVSLCVPIKTSRQLFEKIILAIKQTGINRVVFGGGVSCNSGIIEKFKQLENYDTSDFFVKDELYKDYVGFIRNFSKMGKLSND